jgi:ribosomal protein L29
MKFNDLMKKTPDELKRELDHSEFEMMRHNAQVATGAAGKDTGKIKQYKKTIARIKTLQNRIKNK